MINLQEELSILRINLQDIIQIQTKGYSILKSTEVGRKVKIKILLLGQIVLTKRNSCHNSKNKDRKKLCKGWQVQE